VWAPPAATLSLWWQWRHARRLLRRVYGDDLRLALVHELDAYCDLLGTPTRYSLPPPLCASEAMAHAHACA
jgi:hypothetical protein